MGSKDLCKVLLFVVIMAAWGCAEEMESELPLSSTAQEVAYGGHDYLFVMTPKPWAAAQAYCATYNQASGGGYHLVTVDNANEDSFLNTSENYRGGGPWWIGYSDQGLENFWVWSSGNSTYSNWLPNEPNNANNQDCAADNGNWNDKWDDLNCALQYPFVCERDAVAVGNQGSFTYSASATNDAQTNTFNKTLFLYQDQVFTVGTCGLPGASTPATGSNPYLRLTGPSSPLPSNDNTYLCDTAASVGANISMVVPVSGTYTIKAGCAGSSSCTATVAYSY